MRYTRGQFTNEYYQIWELGLLLPQPRSASIYSVKYRKNQFDQFSRVTLNAASVSDALERACYAITYASPWRPEDIDLHAVYDQDENLLWVDEPFYRLIQKKNEFRGMERREFLAKFGMTSAAIIFGFRPMIAKGATVSVAVAGTASGFAAPPGEQLYTTAGTFSWVAPAGVTSVSVVCIGGGGSANCYYGGGGGGGGLAYKNAISTTPGNSYGVTVGAGYICIANQDQSGSGGNSSFSFSGNTTVASGGQTLAYGSSSGSSLGGIGGSPSGSNDGGGTGGRGGGYYGGGGGAAGYSGNGGLGGGTGSATGSGGSGTGGGGGGGGCESGGSGGGGVGLYGAGSNGAGAGTSAVGGGAGSGGSNGASASVGAKRNGGAYGGGGGYSGATSNGGGDGGSGAVRIIWGAGRSFPSNAT